MGVKEAEHPVEADAGPVAVEVGKQGKDGEPVQGVRDGDEDEEEPGQGLVGHVQGALLGLDLGRNNSGWQR